MCKELNVSRSGFYNYLNQKNNRLIKENHDKEEFDLIKQAYNYKNRHKGARQIKMTLFNTFKIVMNLKKIRRLMRKYGLFCPIRKANPYRRMIKAMKTNNYVPNKLNRNFKTSKPGEHLLTDITYIFYGKERNVCYCSTIKDAATNEILAKKYSRTLDVQFVLDTISQLSNHEFIDFNRCIIHSDQGVHYTSIAYTALLSELNIARSMSRRGNCWDNAPQESFFGHMKDELHVKECESYEETCKELDDYFDYYNNDRGQWGLNKMTPVQYRQFLLSQRGTSLILYNQKELASTQVL
jgi:transposase InsO family protein